MAVIELSFNGMMKQLVREWSEEGADEREQCLGRALAALKRHVPLPDAAGSSEAPRVVIPGAGLGRLVWEVAMLGYEAIGVENALMIIMAGSYVINHLLSCHREAHIYPFAWLGAGPCNVRAAADVGRTVCVPDRLAARRFEETTAACAAAGATHPHARLQVCTDDFSTTSRRIAASAHAVLTCFFIDACGDVVGAIESVHAQLRPGGVWVNCGPLEYEGTAGGHTFLGPTLRLCADEVLLLLSRR